ncbi:MAG: pyridoxine 5'-phosphate synthase [Candidatus Omnitrophica bacterium]|nr:pyridoxine 5'-phosphate synthase [Candidatus Omnitrophota bacterium]
MPRLGVNVDHVATLRQARGGPVPSPLWAARVAERAGCDGIVCHLREDRRHIQEEDLRFLRRAVRTSLNLEMAADPGIVRIACRVKPDQATLVPERRRELTTEGGLDLRLAGMRVRRAIRRLKEAGVRVSLFIDPNRTQIGLAHRLGVPMVELHTGRYAEARSGPERRRALEDLKAAARQARSLGLAVAAGHGLDTRNVRPVARIPEVEELNIGFSIVARSLEVGLEQAVREMVRLTR